MQFNMVFLKEIFHLAEKEAPVIFTENPYCLPANVQSCLVSSLLAQDDSSSDPEIWIQITSLPMYGALLKTSGPEVEELSEISNFTMEDINNKKIRYYNHLVLHRIFKIVLKYVSN